MKPTATSKLKQVSFTIRDERQDINKLGLFERPKILHLIMLVSLRSKNTIIDYNFLSLINLYILILLFKGDCPSSLNSPSQLLTGHVKQSSSPTRIQPIEVTFSHHDCQRKWPPSPNCTRIYVDKRGMLDICPICIDRSSISSPSL